MRIAICDDEKYFAEFIKEKVGKWGDADVYLDPKELIESKKIYDAAFIDIEMGEIDGFKVAEKLHQKNKECILSFFTSHCEFAIHGYEFNAFRYILKDEPEHNVNKYLNDVYEKYQTKYAALNITYKSISRRVRVKDIYYLECSHNTVLVHTQTEEYPWYTNFKGVSEDFLRYGFVRTHKSFMVNLEQVGHLEENCFIMKNGDEVPLGRKYKPEAKMQFMKEGQE